MMSKFSGLASIYLTLILVTSVESQYQWPNVRPPQWGPFPHPNTPPLRQNHQPNTGGQWNNFGQNMKNQFENVNKKLPSGQNGQANHLTHNSYLGSESNQQYNSRFFGSEAPAPSGVGNSNCDQKMYKEFVYSCLRNNASVLLESQMSFPVKQEELKKSCTLWISFFKCISRKIQKCKNHNQFTEGLKEPIRFHRSICTDNKFQQEYLLHAKCIKSVVDSQCSRFYYNLIERIKSEDSSIVNYCCDGLRFKDCIIYPIREKCSKFAEELFVSNLHFLKECGSYRPPATCPTIGNVPKGVPDPRNVDLNRLRGNNIQSNIRDNRLGNGRLVDLTTQSPRRDSKTTPYWPVNIQAAEQKDENFSNVIRFNYMTLGALFAICSSIQYLFM